MTAAAAGPPDHVRAGFGVSSSTAQPLRPRDARVPAADVNPDGEPAPSGDAADPADPGPRTWRLGDLVLQRVDDSGRAAWLASGIEQVPVNGIRLARPVRSLDGRWVLSGWSASRFVAGAPAARPHDIIIAGEALHRGVAGLEEPRVLRARLDPVGWADRLAWGELSPAERSRYPVGSGEVGRRIGDLEAGRSEVSLPAQLIHAQLRRGVLFAGDALPAVVDIEPLWRPPAWAAAIVVVDAIVADGAPTEVLGLGERYGHWRELVRRALLFRLALTVCGPVPAPEALIPLLVAVDRIGPALG